MLTRGRHFPRIPAMFCIWLLAGLAARGERLPVRFYTTADGLPSNTVNRIVLDSHGFLWFATGEGLSRFDGFAFTNYGVQDGLPDHWVGDLLETPDGEYWIATAHTLARFHPEPARRTLFEAYPYPVDPQQRFIGTALANDGKIWLLTSNELLLFDRATRQFEQLTPPRRANWTALLRDGDDSLWLGGENWLVHRLPDGRTEEFGAAEGIPTRHGYFRVADILRGRDGVLWLGTWLGLCRMVPDPQPGKRAVERVYSTRDGLPRDVVFSLFQSRDGKIWVGTEQGLAEITQEAGAAALRIRSYTARSLLDYPGAEGPPVYAFAEDESGNIWISCEGVLRLVNGGFTLYTSQDGLATNGMSALVSDREGHLIAISGDPEPHFLNRFDGVRFNATRLLAPTGLDVTWADRQIHFQDHTGAWWVAGNRGLYRYPRVVRVEDLGHIQPERIYTRRDGLPSELVYRLFEDSRGDIWMAFIGDPPLTRWSRSQETIESFREAEGGKRLETAAAFAEDRAGNIWMALSHGGIARYRHGRFQVFAAFSGFPGGGVSSLFVDRAGRLWAATARSGLVRIDDPDAEQLHGKSYTANAGLSDNSIFDITEDRFGRIYAATSRGVDRLDPETGSIRRYTAADGLSVLSGTRFARRDGEGALWFSGTGVYRFVPTADDRPGSPPSVRITRIVLGGKTHPISELGETRVEGLRQRSRDSEFQLEFGSRNFAAGETIRFQYRLGAGEWSHPAESRSLTFAGLSPGSYTFQVRAVNADGLGSPVPASVVFAIPWPWWERWWFLVLATGAVCAAAWAAHRYRLRQALAVERVRTRIATDLHDDIGSSLTQIAILSEVAQRGANGDHERLAAPLGRIADLSRELVDSMGDIVWAINPSQDHLSDLAHRMRRFASEVFEPREIEFECDVPQDPEHTTLHADLRRQVFLIFKECVHNVVRHSGCRRVRIGLQLRQRRLTLTVADDGRGFIRSANGHGQGLASMEHRVREFGGELKIESAPGQGATISVTAPLAPTQRGRGVGRDDVAQ
jgi:signal transduction histidine kinase/ligand-binding sensor domain-containing protein